MLRTFLGMKQLGWVAASNTLASKFKPWARRPFCDKLRASLNASKGAVQRNADKEAVAVVVGASRGIGLAAVQALSTRWKGHIVATCRDVQAAGALGALWQFMPDRFSMLPMDVCDEYSVS